MSDREPERKLRTPTPEETREVVLKHIREAQDPAEADRILEAYAKAQQFDGVKLAARTVNHLLGNDLGPSLGYSEMLLEDTTLSEETRDFVQKINESAGDASETLSKFGRIKRVIPMEFGGQMILDLDKSGAEEDPQE